MGSLNYLRCVVDHLFLPWNQAVTKQLVAI